MRPAVMLCTLMVVLHVSPAWAEGVQDAGRCVARPSRLAQVVGAPRSWPAQAAWGAASSAAALVPGAVMTVGLLGAAAVVGAVMLAQDAGPIPSPLSSRAVDDPKVASGVALLTGAAWGAALAVPAALAVGALVDGLAWWALADQVDADALAWRAALGVGAVMLTAPWLAVAGAAGMLLVVSARWQADALDGNRERAAMVGILGLGPVLLLAVPVAVGGVAFRAALSPAFVRTVVLGRPCARSARVPSET